MEVREVINSSINGIIKRMRDEPSVEWAFLAGSLADQRRDAFSDIHLGVVSRDTLKDFRKAYALREDILSEIGQPLHLIEREWEHCKMVSVLYGKTKFPPGGLEIDLVFSQLKHLGQQNPHGRYRIIYERSEALKAQFERLPRQKPREEVEQELRQYLSGYPFYVYEVVKAFGRKDWANAQSLAEQMRKAIYFTAAVRAGCFEHGYAPGTSFSAVERSVSGSKRGLDHLSPGEKWVVENSCQAVTRKTIQRLVDLYLACLTAVQAEYQIEQDVERLRQTLPELL